MGRPRRSVWEKDHLTNRTRNALEKAHIYDYDQLGGVIASGEKIKGLGVECVDELNRHLKKWKIGVNSQATRFWIIDCTTKRPILDIAAYEKTLVELAEKNGLRNMTALSNYLTDKVGKPFCPSFLANSKRTDTGNRGLTEWEVYMMKKVVGLTYDPTEATGIFASEPGDDPEEERATEEPQEEPGDYQAIVIAKLTRITSELMTLNGQIMTLVERSKA